MTTPTQPTKVTGTVAFHPKGFGFLNVLPPQDGDVKSAFVAPPDLNVFLAGDTVEAVVAPSGEGRWMATQLKLKTRERKMVMGEIVMRKGQPQLHMDKDVANTDWALDAKGTPVSHGERVVATVTPAGLVLQRKVEPGADVMLERILLRYGIRDRVEEPVVAAAALAMKIPHVLGHRRDLRMVPTVTVDAPSTRDIDDAISVLPADEDGGLRLLVSIADASEFVREGTALDDDAKDRGTSVYLAGRVVPMLPDDLSSNWVSLLPGQDRLALTAELRVDTEGNVVAADVYESLIRSWARLNYTEVAEFLDVGTISEAMKPVAHVMPWFRTVGARIGMARGQRGGVVIERDEARVSFDPQTKMATSIEAVRSNSAHMLIERCMVAANEAIATWMNVRGIPAAYRVHDEPTAEAVAELEVVAQQFGFLGGFGGRLSPKALAAFDMQVQGTLQEAAIRSVLRGTLGPARYTVTPSIHFGLGAPLYLHFTSPIRRYSDLLVHRNVKKYLNGERNFRPRDPDVETLSVHLNQRAYVAAKAETDRHRALTARIMAGKIGEIAKGHVTRIRPFGLVVQLVSTLVEGAVLYEGMTGGGWVPDALETQVTGPGGVFRVGTPITVKVVGADEALGRVEFQWVPEPAV